MCRRLASDLHVTAVAGVGSRLGGDDSIGPVLVEQLQQRYLAHQILQPDRQKIEFHCWDDCDALTLTQCLLELQQPLLLIDCADLGAAGGEYRLLREAEIQHCDEDALSCHGFGIAEGLALARALGYQETVTLLAIQGFAYSISPELSPAMQRCVPGLLTVAEQWLAIGPVLSTGQEAG